MQQLQNTLPVQNKGKCIEDINMSELQTQHVSQISSIYIPRSFGVPMLQIHAPNFAGLRGGQQPDEDQICRQTVRPEKQYSVLFSLRF